MMVRGTAPHRSADGKIRTSFGRGEAGSDFVRSEPFRFAFRWHAQQIRPRTFELSGPLAPFLLTTTRHLSLIPTDGRRTSDRVSSFECDSPAWEGNTLVVDVGITRSDWLERCAIFTALDARRRAFNDYLQGLIHIRPHSTTRRSIRALDDGGRGGHYRAALESGDLCWKVPGRHRHLSTTPDLLGAFPPENISRHKRSGFFLDPCLVRGVSEAASLRRSLFSRGEHS